MHFFCLGKLLGLILRDLLFLMQANLFLQEVFPQASARTNESYNQATSSNWASWLGRNYLNTCRNSTLIFQILKYCEVSFSAEGHKVVSRSAAWNGNYNSPRRCCLCLALALHASCVNIYRNYIHNIKWYYIYIWISSCTRAGPFWLWCRRCTW